MSEGEKEASAAGATSSDENKLEDSAVCEGLIFYLSFYAHKEMSANHVVY